MDPPCRIGRLSPISLGGRQFPRALFNPLAQIQHGVLDVIVNTVEEAAPVGAGRRVTKANVGKWTVQAVM
jgi:hypothetical protein